MQKHKLLWVVVLTCLLFLFLPHPAHAYIDPGTTGSIFAMLAPFIAIFLAFLGFMIRPFRRFFASIITKLRRGSTAESLTSKEQPAPSDLPDDKNSRGNTIEDPKN